MFIKNTFECSLMYQNQICKKLVPVLLWPLPTVFSVCKLMSHSYPTTLSEQITIKSMISLYFPIILFFLHFLPVHSEEEEAKGSLINVYK